jgi:uncharacterized RDD family membrane protein YckC
MRKLSIATAQNIVIDFQLASLGQRLLAFVIDMIILGAVLVLLSLILGIIHPALLYLLFPVFLLYTLILESFMNGQTFGKKAMKLRVVSLQGKEPAPLDLVIRWAFRMVDIWFSIGSLAVIFISTTGRAQRLGGLLSNTMVISLQDEMALSLKDILKIEDRSQYQPVYPDVIRFSEEEMLTVKSVLERYALYRNQAHRSLLEETAQRCADVLGLQPMPAKHTEFLKTLIKDYIVITRS